MNLYTHIHQSLKEQYVACMHYSKQRYMKELMIAVITAGICAAGYFSFEWYKKRQDIQAFAGLVEISKSYDAAAQKAQQMQAIPQDEWKENPWEDVQLLLEAIASAHSSSSLSPFFTMYEAQLALDADHNYEKACDLMEKGLRRMAKNSPMYDMFNLKRIKMLLDHPLEDVRHQALQELQQVAGQKGNYVEQEALWTLGLYQSFAGNMDQAIQAWTKLAEQARSEKALITSPWTVLAQDKLKTLQITLPLIDKN